MPGKVAIIQARMGARRFPGEVLEDLQGKPVLRRVLDRADRTIRDAFQREHVTLGIYDRPEEYRLRWLLVPGACEDARLRVRIDTVEDLEVPRRVWSALGPGVETDVVRPGIPYAAGINLVLHRGESRRACNLAPGLEINCVQVAECVLRTLGKSKDAIGFVPDRPRHDYRYSRDPSKAEALGWQGKWVRPDGLADTVQWYRDHEPWWRAVRKKLQLRRREKSWYEQRKE